MEKDKKEIQRLQQSLWRIGWCALPSIIIFFLSVTWFLFLVARESYHAASYVFAFVVIIGLVDIVTVMMWFKTFNVFSKACMKDDFLDSNRPSES